MIRSGLPVTPLDVDLQPLPLRPEHRCDRCGARARARASCDGCLTGLLFCGHHAAQHADALASQGWTLHFPPLDD